MMVSISGASGAESPPEASPEELDRMAEAAVLALLLSEQPAQLTADEVIRALGDGRLSALAIEDAADRLKRSGLVHREGKFIIPSRAALRMDRLPIDAAKRILPPAPPG